MLHKLIKEFCMIALFIGVTLSPFIFAAPLLAGNHDGLLQCMSDCVI